MFTPHYVCLCLLEEHLDKLSTDFDDIFLLRATFGTISAGVFKLQEFFQRSDTLVG